MHREIIVAIIVFILILLVSSNHLMAIIIGGAAGYLYGDSVMSNGGGLFNKKKPERERLPMFSPSKKLLLLDYPTNSSSPKNLFNLDIPIETRENMTYPWLDDGFIYELVEGKKVTLPNKQEYINELTFLFLDDDFIVILKDREYKGNMKFDYIITGKIDEDIEKLRTNYGNPGVKIGTVSPGNQFTIVPLLKK
jgi:hypothetical protein